MMRASPYLGNYISDDIFAKYKFREAVKGRLKFTKTSWTNFCEHVMECRALEVIDGLEKVICHVICDKYRHLPFGWRSENVDFEVLKDRFQSDMHRMINTMIDLLLDEEQQELLNDKISLYNPAHGNDKGFMDGRMEQRDINGQNMQVITVGGYFSVRCGLVIEGFKSDARLKRKTQIWPC